jgi:hypothetical protein
VAEDYRRASESDEPELGEPEPIESGEEDDGTFIDPGQTYEAPGAGNPAYLEGELVERFPEFDPRLREDFEGLAYVGRLEDTVDVLFHRFVVRTLTDVEKLEIALVVKQWQETVAYGKAYRAAVVAAGLMSVDGRPILSPRNDISRIRQQFDYITKRWHDTVIDLLFSKIDALEGRVIAILQEMGLYDDRRLAAVARAGDVERPGPGPADSEAGA